MSYSERGTQVIVGSFLEDAWDAVASVPKAAVNAVSDGLKAVGDLVSQIPGGDWIVDAVNSGAGWVGDFAKTTSGMVVMRAISSSMYILTAGAIGPFLGPQIASVAFAFPGVVKGDDFDKAFFSELADRTVKTAQILGAGQAAELITGPLRDTIGQLFERLRTALPNVPYGDALKRLGITPQSLAQELGIQEYVAAKAMEFVTRNFGEVDPADYDLLSGKRITKMFRVPTAAPSLDPNRPKTTAALKAQWETAKAQGRTPAVLKALETQYLNSKNKPVDLRASALSSLSQSRTVIDITSATTKPNPLISATNKLSPGLVNTVVMNPPPAFATQPDVMTLSPDEYPEDSKWKQLAVVALITSPAWATMLFLRSK